jgi:hypothetical protein
MSWHLNTKYSEYFKIRYYRKELLPGAELPLVESFSLLNKLFPFPSILDKGCPIFDLPLANVLSDVILYLGFPYKKELDKMT